MKLNRIIALALAAALLVCGCALAAEKEKYVNTPEEIAKAKEWADTLDPRTYDTHITIELACQDLKDNVDYQKGDVLGQWYTEHFNIDWDLVAIPTANANDKIRTMINSGEAPDVLRWNDFIVNEVTTYIDQELFYRFPDDWKQRWPHLAAMQAKVPAAAVLEQKMGGTYAILRATYYHYYPYDKIYNHHSAYLRRDWADAVGFPIKDAYTPSEIMEYARLIKEKDPGNVGDKLIPLTADTGNFLGLFIGSTYPRYCQVYRGTDGRYHWGFEDEETLKYLKLFKQAFDEGLISREFYTISNDDARNLYCISGISGGWIGAGSVPHDVHQHFRDDLGLTDDNWHMAAIVGEDGFYHDNESSNMWGGTYFSGDIDPAVFERMMDIMDFAMSDEGLDLRCNGFQYCDWKYDEKGVRVPIFDPEKYQSSSRSETSWPLYDLMAGCGDDNGWNPDPVFKDSESTLWYRYAKKIADAKRAHEKEDSIIPTDWNIFGFSSDTQAMLTSINYSSLCANILTSKDIEAAWKQAIAENRFIVDPALAELNEKFGGQPAGSGQA